KLILLLTLRMDCRTGMQSRAVARVHGSCSLRRGLKPATTYLSCRRMRTSMIVAFSTSRTECSSLAASSPVPEQFQLNDCQSACHQHRRTPTFSGGTPDNFAY